MRDDDSEVKMDELEEGSLQKVISEVETALAVSTPGTRGILENLLSNAKGRLGTLEKKIKETKAEKEARAREEVNSIARLAESETALSRKEKEIYSGFLKEEYFTERDFGGLEQFYGKTWDRLSESGKDEMSHRIWEGIRRDEFKFSELPRNVQAKEAERVYNTLSEPTAEAEIRRIPIQDRSDFCHAFEDGDIVKSGEVLDRESFRQNLWREPARGAAVSVVTLPREDIPVHEATRTADPNSLSSLEVGAIDFSQIKQAGDSPPVSAQDISNARGASRER
jgi:hypothetical protein